MNRERKKEFSEIGPADISMLNVKELEAFLKIDQKTIYRYVSLRPDSLCPHPVKYTFCKETDPGLDRRAKLPT